MTDGLPGTRLRAHESLDVRDISPPPGARDAGRRAYRAAGSGVRPGPHAPFASHPGYDGGPTRRGASTEMRPIAHGGGSPVQGYSAYGPPNPSLGASRSVYGGALQLAPGQSLASGGALPLNSCYGGSSGGVSTIGQNASDEREPYGQDYRGAPPAGPRGEGGRAGGRARVCCARAREAHARVRGLGTRKGERARDLMRGLGPERAPACPLTAAAALAPRLGVASRRATHHAVTHNAVAGVTKDSLWTLDDAHKRSPQPVAASPKGLDGDAVYSRHHAFTRRVPERELFHR